MYVSQSFWGVCKKTVICSQNPTFHALNAEVYFVSVLSLITTHIKDNLIKIMLFFLTQQKWIFYYIMFISYADSFNQTGGPVGQSPAPSLVFLITSGSQLWRKAMGKTLSGTRVVFARSELASRADPFKPRREWRTSRRVTWRGSSSKMLSSF